MRVRVTAGVLLAASLGVLCTLMFVVWKYSMTGANRRCSLSSQRPSLVPMVVPKVARKRVPSTMLFSRALPVRAVSLCLATSSLWMSVPYADQLSDPAYSGIAAGLFSSVILVRLVTALWSRRRTRIMSGNTRWSASGSPLSSMTGVVNSVLSGRIAMSSRLPYESSSAKRSLSVNVCVL
mgnify:FL=1